MATSTQKIGKTIIGSKLDDKLLGTNNAESIDGGLGNDTIRGYGGDDIITGGGGKDTFIFEKSQSDNGLDTITDFTSITKNSSQADLLDLSLVVTAKNISNNTIGNYVWVINEKLYVDVSGGGINGGRGLIWANLPGLTGGEKINIRTASYDGPLSVTRFDAPALKLLNDTGSSSTDGYTQDGHIVAPTGTLGTVYYSLDGINWLTTYTPPTQDGTYTLYCKQTYGGVDSSKSTLTFTIDTKIDTPTGSLQNDTGDGSEGSGSDHLTSNGSLNFSTPSETVTRQFSLDGGNTWSSSYTPPNTDGTYTVYVRDTDRAGNQAQSTVTFTLDKTIDTPTVALATDSSDGGIGRDTDGTTNDGTLDISAPASDVIREYSLDGGTTWSSIDDYDPTALTDGEYTVYIRDTDLAGNTATSSVTFTLDTSADADANLVVNFDDDSVADADKGNISLTVTGLDSDIDPSNVTVVVKDKDGHSATAIYDEISGKWLLDGSLLVSGALTATVSVMDAAGNESQANDTATLLPGDIVPPSASGISLTADDELKYGVLNAGDKVTVTVTMDEDTIVDTTGGTPRVALKIGDNTVYADYTGGSGSKLLTFEYKLLAGQNDANGISIVANSIDAHGGTLQDAAGNTAVLSHAAVADNAAYMVDTVDPVPTLSSQSVGTPVTTQLGKFEATGNTTGTDWYPSMLVLNSSGDFVVTWWGYDPGNAVFGTYVQRCYADGTPYSAPVKLDGWTATNESDVGPTVYALGTTGKYAVVWQGYNGTYPASSVYVQIFEADGTQTVPKLKFDDPNPGLNSLPDNYDGNPHITSVGSNGDFVLTWSGVNVTTPGNTAYSIFVQKVAADGSLIGSTMQLDGVPNSPNLYADSGSKVTAVGTDGAYVVVWDGFDAQNDHSIFLQKFNADGTKSGAMQNLETLYTYPDHQTERDEGLPLVTSVGTDGSFVVTWGGGIYSNSGSSDAAVYVQKFDSTATPTGACVQLNASLYIDRYYDTAAIGKDGMYAVAWAANHIDSYATIDKSVYIQLFNADGTTHGGMIQLDRDPTAAAFDDLPKIHALGDSGDFAVSWQASDGTATGYTVCVQKFDANGSAIGGILQFDAPDGPGAGGADGMAVVQHYGASNDLLVAWSGVDGNGDRSIYVANAVTPAGGDSTQKASSNEAGKLYLVDATATIGSESDILALASDHYKELPNGGANVKTPVDASGLASGDYYLYAVDLAGNIGMSTDMVTVSAPVPTGGTIFVTAENGAYFDSNSNGVLDGADIDPTHAALFGAGGNVDLTKGAFTIDFIGWGGASPNPGPIDLSGFDANDKIVVDFSHDWVGTGLLGKTITYQRGGLAVSGGFQGYTFGAHTWENKSSGTWGNQFWGNGPTHGQAQIGISLTTGNLSARYWISERGNAGPLIPGLGSGQKTASNYTQLATWKTSISTIPKNQIEVIWPDTYGGV